MRKPESRISTETGCKPGNCIFYIYHFYIYHADVRGGLKRSYGAYFFIIFFVVIILVKILVKDGFKIRRQREIFHIFAAPCASKISRRWGSGAWRYLAGKVFCFGTASQLSHSIVPSELKCGVPGFGAGTIHEVSGATLLP
jgi:hypothetical protein